MSESYEYQFRPHDPPGICDRCGSKRHLSELRKEWTGLMVCRECWDPRHPQELIHRRPADKLPSERTVGGVAVFIEPASITPDDL